MVQRKVTLIEGRHLTAADKRSIRDGIEHLREAFAKLVQASPTTPPDYGALWLRRRGSRKRYSIAPCPAGVSRYRVTVRETETNSYGRKFDRDTIVLVAVSGVLPLHHPVWATMAQSKQAELAL